MFSSIRIVDVDDFIIVSLILCGGNVVIFVVLLENFGLLSLVYSVVDF